VNHSHRAAFVRAHPTQTAPAPPAPMVVRLALNDVAAYDGVTRLETAGQTRTGLVFGMTPFLPFPLLSKRKAAVLLAANATQSFAFRNPEL
jgi:hypothetical protein